MRSVLSFLSSLHSLVVFTAVLSQNSMDFFSEKCVNVGQKAHKWYQIKYD